MEIWIGNLQEINETNPVKVPKTESLHNTLPPEKKQKRPRFFMPFRQSNKIK